MSNFELKPHGSVPFFFTWALGTEMLGDVLLAPSKQVLNFTTPCCWGRVERHGSNGLQTLSCSICRQEWEQVDESWMPDISSYQEAPVNFVRASPIRAWLVQTGEIFLGPLHGEVMGLEVHEHLIRYAERLESFTVRFQTELDRRTYSIDANGTMNYHEGELLYRALWKEWLRNVRDLTRG